MDDKLKKLRITPDGDKAAESKSRRGAAGGLAAAAGRVGSAVANTVKGALGLPGAGPGEFEVPFNPKEYVIEQSNTFAEIAIPGLEAPIIQFVRGNTEKLSFELLIDTTDHPPGSKGRDARTKANEILRLARIDGERHAPPVCLFEWGEEVMRGVIESVRRQFVLFDPDGTPTRIQVTLGVKRYRTLVEQLGPMNRQSPDRTKTDVVRQGDTLPAIAHRMYGDETLWREIATRNGIRDPAKLTPGRVLEIPKVDFVRRVTEGGT
ncbi:LysM peptidoglycan-binding domain-containing protein [Pendulispora brunnea]|uniref:LysM peptidoglycan-binding domain-containing protein n=1 Tax=Pendulispora brunnea TaxID=2905690 RepID=A0ABZ2KKX8_9BACT